MAAVDPEVERLAELEQRLAAALEDRARWAAMVQAMRAVIADRAAKSPVPVPDDPALLAAVRECDALRNALRAAVEWMDEDGCDCGVPADQPCALCVARAVLADGTPLPPVPVPVTDGPTLVEVARERDRYAGALAACGVVARYGTRTVLPEYACDSLTAVSNLRTERDALQSRLDALATREPTDIQLETLHTDLRRWEAFKTTDVGIWRHVRNALLAAPAPAPTSDGLPAAPSCTRCMDLCVVQTGDGSVESCPACTPAPALNRCATCRAAVGPSPGWHECRGAARAAAILRRAEAELAIVANTVGRIIYPDEADALIAELARLRAAKVKP